MAYVIAEPCIGTKDTACADVCPVDAIHPKKDEPGSSEAPQLYINPEECICCAMCVPVCPVIGKLCGGRSASGMEAFLCRSMRSGLRGWKK